MTLCMLQKALRNRSCFDTVFIKFCVFLYVKNWVFSEILWLCWIVLQGTLQKEGHFEGLWWLNGSKFNSTHVYINEFFTIFQNFSKVFTFSRKCVFWCKTVKTGFIDTFDPCLTTYKIWFWWFWCVFTTFWKLKIHEKQCKKLFGFWK